MLMQNQLNIGNFTYLVLSKKFLKNLVNSLQKSTNSTFLEINYIFLMNFSFPNTI